MCIPDYLVYGEEVQGYSGMYEVEYWSNPGQPLGSVYQQNMPCAVCSGTKRKFLMVPAQESCPRQWRMEYYGYLMAPHATDNYQAPFVCVDNDPDVVAGKGKDTNQPQNVETTCNGLPCLPHGQQELTCVVCTL